MTSGQYRALILVLVILGVEVLTNPAVKTVLGGWISLANTPQLRGFQSTTGRVMS